MNVQMKAREPFDVHERSESLAKGGKNFLKF
jgi:hypothetical protein